MKFTSARNAWHWAFDPDVKCIDTREQVNMFGVEFSARGADNRIMDHVEKGMLQQVIHQLKQDDKVAWAWGMYAYAPMGAAQGFERATLQNWLRTQFHEATDGKYLGKPEEIKILMLSRIAYEDVAHEDRTGMRKRRKYADLARLLNLNVEDYKKDWHRHYVRFRNMCHGLPERALPPVANVVWRILDLQDNEPGAAEDLREMLGVKI